MRAIIILFVTVLLSACETIKLPSKTDPMPLQKSDALSAQELGSGECGVFFWTKSKPRKFVFFQKQGAANALYYSGGNEQALRVETGDSSFSLALEIDIHYRAPVGDKITVKGVFEQAVEDGARIPSGLINITKQDGWQEIIPVSGVYVCR